MNRSLIRFSKKPLAGVRAIEMGQFIASGFAGAMLAYYGAEVIKVEPLSGDGIRTWRVLDNTDTSLWWYSIARNKKSICVDMSTNDGSKIIRDLSIKSDIIIENFKPGVMEKWGLGPDDLKSLNSNLVYTRISGFGQTGPYSHKPGFASVCEGFGGLRYVTAEPAKSDSESPLYVRPNLSLGDSLASMHAVLGSLIALRQREMGDGKGQVVDVSIFESVFNMLESVVPEASRTGANREPAGTGIPGIVPSNTYPCSDGKFIIIGANSDNLYRKLMTTIERSDLAGIGNNAARSENQDVIDGAISKWSQNRTSIEAKNILEIAGVPVGLLYSANDMLKDQHFHARGLFEEIQTPGNGFNPKSIPSNTSASKCPNDQSQLLHIPAIHPKLVRTPGSTEYPGPSLGAHTNEVLKGLLGMDERSIELLRSKKIVL